jgi:lipopolysaccharide transport system permease protein
LLQLVLYTVVFSIVLGIRFGDEISTGRFAEFLFCALLPWMAIQESTVRSATSLIENSNLIKKMRFPLETIPFSLVVSAAIHQLLASLVFVTVIIGTGSFSAERSIVAFPILLVQMVLMFGLALSISCLNVYFRDIAHVISVGFMLLFWLTPIVYPKSRAPETFRLVLDLNPLTHMVEAYRWALLGAESPALSGVLYWALFSGALYYLGKRVLRNTRKELVDLI